VGKRRLNHSTEGAKLRALANHRLVELLLSFAAYEAADKQDITRTDLLMALRTCAIVKSELHGTQWRRVVQGNDMDGNALVMTVTVIYPIRRIRVIEVEREMTE
jgi:hypothetical protein